MQYFVMTYQIHHPESLDHSVAKLTLAREQTCDGHPVLNEPEFLLRAIIGDKGSYRITQIEGATVSNQNVSDFGELWVEVLQRVGSTPVFILDASDMHGKLNPLIEAWGYLPLSAQSVLDGFWLAQLLLSGLRERTLLSIADYMGISRDAKDDLDLTREIAISLLDGLHNLPIITLQTIAVAAQDKPLIQRLADDIVHAKLITNPQDGLKVIDGLAFHPRAIEAREQDETVDHEPKDLSRESLKLLRNALSNTGRLVYERRQGQEMMVKQVASAFLQDRHVIVEAGTGTGKSLAYLLPSILFAHHTGQRVVIATHTIALQEQLWRQDLQAIKETVPIDFRASILKGRNHYVCMRKVAFHMRSLLGLSVKERDFFLRVAAWLTDTTSGDREELAMVGREQEQWLYIQSESESCINKRCPFFKDCYYFRARQVASEADLIITNHSLVLSDLKADHRVLPAYDYLVIDEAHQLEEQATKQLGAEVSEDDIRRLMDRLLDTRSGQLTDLSRQFATMAAQGQMGFQPYAMQFDRFLRIAADIKKHVNDVWLTFGLYVNTSNNGKNELRIQSKLVESSDYTDVVATVKALEDAQETLNHALSDYDQLVTQVELDNDWFGKMEDVVALVRNLFNSLIVCVDVLLARRETQHLVGWVAVRRDRGKERVSFHLAPLTVAQVLQRELFMVKSVVILTSATLSVAGEFNYFMSQIGLLNLPEGKVAAFGVESPFDYERQALLCIPKDMPDIKDNNHFTMATSAAILDIAKAANGRTLVLFTSYQMMSFVYHSVKSQLEALGIRILAQGMDDHRRTKLVDTFRATERAVLFGVNSFWEGIDIPGDDLSCLIIVKLPFAVPTHPIMEARHELLTKMGRKPFQDYSVPQAVIRFTQGFGRLIRTRSDRGVVFVFDKRVITTGYGKLFLRSLPGPRVVVDTLEQTRNHASAFFLQNVTR